MNEQSTETQLPLPFDGERAGQIMLLHLEEMMRRLKDIEDMLETIIEQQQVAAERDY